MKHENRAHAICSASGAHRWMNCAPSAKLEMQFPDTSSEAAKEGTLAHEICEAKARHYFDTKNYSKRKLNAALKKLKESELYKSEMDSYTDDYLDYVKGIALSFDKMAFAVLESRLDLQEWIPEGFGTADCIIICNDELNVIDFKYGKGVPVSAENNPQMQLYALGAYRTYGMIYSIKKVRMHIVQPRIDNNNSWETDAASLLKFGEQAKKKAALAFAGEGDFNAGDWCTFCRAKQQCRARATKAVELAGFTDKTPPLISDAEVGEFLRRGEAVAKWLSDLKDYALGACLAGKEIAGWKAVEGRGSRMWSNQEEAFVHLKSEGIDEALLYKREPLSVAQVEKMLGKKPFEEMAANYVVKTKGKPTLVKESDKRSAITNVVSAKEAFGNQEVSQ